MAVVINTYTELVAAADVVQEMIAINSGAIVRWRSEISGIVSALASIGTEYGPIVAAADTILATDPTDDAVKYIHAHVQKLLADFTAAQTLASSLDALANPPPPP